MKSVKEFTGVTSSRLFYINNELYINGCFNYTCYDIIPCYTKDGEYIKDIEVNRRYTHEDNQTEKYYNHTYNVVVQLGYDFKLIPFRDFVRTKDQLQDFIMAFNSSDLGYELKYKTKDSFDPIYMESNQKHLKLKEVCFLSTSTQAEREIGKDILDFNYFEYKQNLDKFVLNNEDHKYNAMALFEQNINVICTYFDCTELDLQNKKWEVLIEKRIKRTIKRNLKK